MKITAIDLTHKKFGKSFRGYRCSEVDELLRSLATELETAARDRAQMEDQIEVLRGEAARFREMEATLNNAILLAQRTADDLQSSAHRDAEVVQKEAQQKAAQVVEDAYRERQELALEIRRLTERRSMLLDALRSANRDLEDWIAARRWEEDTDLEAVRLSSPSNSDAATAAVHLAGQDNYEAEEPARKEATG